MEHANKSALFGLGWYDDSGDSRGVTLGLDGKGSAWVGERSEGQTTREVFGSEAHEHRVFLDAGTLGSLIGVAGEGDARLAGALRALFDNGDFYLSDLMDMLDAAKAAYRYCSCTEEAAALRGAG